MAPNAAAHRRALVLMVLAALLWSTAGVVTRQLDSARGFELSFWRSSFNALALVLLLSALRGPAALWASLRRGSKALWLSGLCWAVMFTAFMMALTLTTVANVLITMALAPLFTALLARWVLKQALPLRTAVAMGVAGLGIALMYAQELTLGGGRHLLGTLVAMAVPLAAACNWTLLQHHARAQQRLHPAVNAAASAEAAALGSAPVSNAPADMLVAVLVGAVLSALCTLPLALPLRASQHDLVGLALLGVFQLAVPCLLAVHAARHLAAPEAALLSLLEVIFGVAWVWLASQESPSGAVLGGGLMVLGALAVNEIWALRERGAARGAERRNPAEGAERA